MTFSALMPLIVHSCFVKGILPLMSALSARLIRRCRTVAVTTPAVVVAAFLTSATATHAQTYTLSTLATFNKTNGSTPYAGVTFDSAGNLYGTTYQGGDLSLNGGNGYGTVYKIAADTNILSTLATFKGTNGLGPVGGLTFDSAGNLYGTTSSGGTSSFGNDYGTVFKIAAGTNSLSTLAIFNSTNGAKPYSVTVDSAGNLYGVTYQGGTGNNGIGYGTVYKIVAGTNTITTLVAFNSTNGANPEGDITLDGAGNLYGTTTSGGTNGYGIVYKIAAGTSTLSTLASFEYTNGANPAAGVTIDSAGNLYGTTVSGGTGNAGTVYKIAAGTNTITTLAAFNYPTTGANLYGSVTLDSDGNLFGTNGFGSKNGYGTVFKIAAGSNTLSTLAFFSGTNGSSPQVGVTLDGAGNLYGTTVSGGTGNAGTVFKLSLNGSAAAPEPGTLALLLPILPLFAAGLRRRTGKAAHRSA